MRLAIILLARYQYRFDACATLTIQAAQKNRAVHTSFTVLFGLLLQPVVPSFRIFQGSHFAAPAWCEQGPRPITSQATHNQHLFSLACSSRARDLPRVSGIHTQHMAAKRNDAAATEKAARKLCVWASDPTVKGANALAMRPVL